MTDREKLSELLGHTFKKPALLTQALTHSSITKNRSGRLESNERLEFLGDRALGLVVAEWLFNQFSDEEEGDLARRFAALVRREALAQVADELNLASYLIVDPADENTVIGKNSSVLADACEALIGALYLDGGITVVQPFIMKYWTGLLEADINPPQDAKTALQEWAQGQGIPLPVYREINREGPSHEPIFTMEVCVGDFAPVQAQGSSKRIAEQRVAEILLETIQSDND